MICELQAEVEGKLDESDGKGRDFGARELTSANREWGGYMHLEEPILVAKTLIRKTAPIPTSLAARFCETDAG